MLAMRIWLEALAGTGVDAWPCCDMESEGSPIGLGLLCMMVLLEKVGVRPLSCESFRKPDELLIEAA